MKSFIQEAMQHPNIGAPFVGKARTIAHKFGVPVEWLLAAMSWETSQYGAYNPNKVWDGHKWIDPADWNGQQPADELHWARNTSDHGGGLVGFTPLDRTKAIKTPVEQIDDVENYLRSRIRDYRIPTPFASPEDFYCVVYAPGISGKPDSYTWTYLGKTYSKKTQMDIYRGFLARYDMPKTGDAMDDGDDASLLWWVPGEKKQVGPAKTNAANVPVYSGPGSNFAIVSRLPLSGTSVRVLDQVRGADIIDGNAKWDRIAAGYVSDTQISFD